jgi:hypothetical protein
MAETFEPMDKGPTLHPQRATGPGGPIGLPGQDCYGACFHLCATGGTINSPYFQQCLDNCTSTCAEIVYTSGGF